MKDDKGSSAKVSEAEAPPVNSDAPVSGRSVFMIRTMEAGVEVTPAFLVNGQDLSVANAVIFPTAAYANQQIDELRQAVNAHFEEAARIGAQLIANARQNEQAAAAAADPAESGVDVLELGEEASRLN